MARSVIKQSVVLSASAESLFATYMDPLRHAAITGGKAVISARPGSKFLAFDGTLWGTTLAVVAPRLIVQSWRSKKFHASDPDSTLILAFVPHGEERSAAQLTAAEKNAVSHRGQALTALVAMLEGSGYIRAP